MMHIDECRALGTIRLEVACPVLALPWEHLVSDQQLSTHRLTGHLVEYLLMVVSTRKGGRHFVATRMATMASCVLGGSAPSTVTST